MSENEHGGENIRPYTRIEQQNKIHASAKAW